MFTQPAINTAKKLGITALLTAAAAVSGHLQAVEVRNHANSLFHQDMVGLNALTPVHLMSDDQLFFAAQAERDASMSSHLKQANHIWLRSFVRQGSRGTSAMRRFLRKSLSRYNDSAQIIKLNNDSQNQEPDYMHLPDKYSYSLDVRRDELEFELEYRF